MGISKAAVRPVTYTCDSHPAERVLVELHSSYEVSRTCSRLRRHEAAGLEHALEFLEGVRFDEDEIAYLQSLPLFQAVRGDFFDYLRRFRFTGDVWALPEGTPFFAGEPILRVTAAIAEAQLMETSLLAIVHFQTLIASKAARVTTAAGDLPVIEFGSRRAHGVEAAVLAARAAFIGGCSGTSNAFAACRFGIPPYGTQAHSYIMAHAEESDAFQDFLDVFPKESTLLVDTYNVRAAIEKIIAMGRKPGGVRLDSGDVLADSIWARDRLNRAGWSDVQIFASGDLDENRVAALIREGARIDAFGVGTALSTSADAPYVGVIYKLVEVETGGLARGTAKFSEEKKTYPGCKQIFRFIGRDGKIARDVIALHDEDYPHASPLLVPVMFKGKRTYASDLVNATHTARERFLVARKQLPPNIFSLGIAESSFPVKYSRALEESCEELRKTYAR